MGGEETTPGRAGSARSHSPGYLQTQVEGDFLWKEKMVSYPWRRCLCFPPFCAHHEPHQQPQTPQAMGKPRNYRPTLFAIPFITAALFPRLPFSQHCL